VTPAPGPAPADSPVEAAAAHARRYSATSGADGHDWNGAPVLLLSVLGRRTGTGHRTPLTYGALWDLMARIWPPTATTRPAPGG
jgi:hypothetical protein